MDILSSSVKTLANCLLRASALSLSSVMILLLTLKSATVPRILFAHLLDRGPECFWIVFKRGCQIRTDEIRFSSIQLSTDCLAELLVFIPMSFTAGSSSLLVQPLLFSAETPVFSFKLGKISSIRGHLERNILVHDFLNLGLKFIPGSLYS